MKTILCIFIIFLYSTGLLLLTHGSAVSAVETQTGTLSITPVSTIMTQNNTQSYSVAINTGGQLIYGADAVITYPKDLVEIKNVANGDFFSNDDFSGAFDGSNGRIELHGFIFTGDGKSGSGTFATFQLLAKAGSGTGNLTFICGSTNPTSKILNDSGTNIINCQALSSANFSLTGGGSPSPTATITPSPSTSPSPSPAPSPTAAPQPTATQAPQQPGNADPTCSGLTVTPNAGVNPLTTTLICIGNDMDGDITAAEFTLGDGRTQLVTKNVGRLGSISTQAAYNIANIYTVTCRVRDNNDRFSGVPDACKKTIEVASNGSVTSTTSRIVVASAKYLPRPDEPQIVDLTPYRPTTPTPTPTRVPEESPAPGNESALAGGTSSFPRILIGLGIIVGALVIGGLFIRKSRKHDLPPTPPPQPPIVS